MTTKETPRDTQMKDHGGHKATVSAGPLTSPVPNSCGSRLEPGDC